jgi:hypothetical protein
LRHAQAGEYGKFEDIHPNRASDHRCLQVVNERATDTHGSPAIAAIGAASLTRLRTAPSYAPRPIHAGHRASNA